MGNQNGVLVFRSVQKPSDGKSDIWCVSAKASHNDKNTSKVRHRVLPFERLLKIILSTPVAVQDIAHLGHRFEREERQWIIFSTFYSEQKHI